MMIPPSRIVMGSCIRSSQGMYVVALAKEIMLKRWAWSSVVMVVRDPRRPGMFMCVDGWHRCQAGELLERS
eukprot:1876126-Prymnesium_polylepis.1